MIFPPDFISLYENCACCGSGSGSGSSSSCACKYLTSTLQGSSYYGGFFQSCSGSPVWNNCISDFVATVILDYSNCGSVGFGSCSSGSGSGSLGAEAILDGPETGSAFDCPQTCPDCCSYFPKRFEFPLKCRCVATGNNFDAPTTCILMSRNMLNPEPPCNSSGAFVSGSGSCLGYRPDKCPWFFLSQYSLDFSTGGRYSGLYIPFDTDGGMYGDIRNAGIVSCDPVQITGDILFFPFISPSRSPCYANCAESNPGGFGEFNCIRGTLTITEAASGGGGGGGPVL